MTETEKLLVEINSLRGEDDINSRCVNKDLTETNTRRRSLFDRYETIMLREN